ncbi:MAG: hypothetical protein M0Z71_16335, partial [Nitrospiraceae bacterium]|nr:hypothetical protein [Nitrospiraceae bacterium]
PSTSFLPPVALITEGYFRLFFVSFSYMRQRFNFVSFFDEAIRCLDRRADYDSMEKGRGASSQIHPDRQESLTEQNRGNDHRQTGKELAT